MQLTKKCPKYTYRKDGVYYFSKAVPKDLLDLYCKPRIVKCLGTSFHFMRLVSLFLLNVLAFNAFAAEDLSDFEKGLRVLLELELNKFESCLKEGKTDCDDSEVDNFLRLLDEGRPVVMVPPDYPVSGLRDSLSAEVIVQITVTKSGEVVRATATSCKFGRGPRDLKHRWEDEGRPCKAFRKS